MKIELNIFTNSTISAPKTDIIRRTYDSFCETFGREYPVTVYMDVNPNVRQSMLYYKNLLKIFKNVHITNSLSMGYIESVKNSDADYLVQLEHDWLWNKSLIKHSLEEICAEMSFRKLYHLRFNKRPNVVSGWDIGLKEINGNDVAFCETSVLSNNPHIINRKLYTEKCLPLIKLDGGSKGIEENLSHKGLTGCIYGPIDYPQTIVHQDGRRKH